ncbi:MAG: DEAD/DEAH box helicase [Bryobacteraceae bacterium]
MSTFSELALSPVLKTNLARHGFVEPTTVQSQSIPPALEGRDVVATAQTGTGKTLAFVLPILEKLSKQPGVAGVSAVILSPTRELAIQIHETLIKLTPGTGIRAAVVIGGLNEQNQLRMIRNGAQVIIATPGRLGDFLNRRLVKLGGAKTLVLDEADRMLDMGFLPTIKLILAELPTERQTMFFSATIETSVAHLINSHLKNPVRVTVGSTTKPVDNVSLHVYEVEQDRKLGLLHSMLKTQDGSFLVFARTKHGADRLAKKLSAGGVKTTRIHGDRTQNQRNQALRGFQEGMYRVLVATDVAARGIHVEGIAHVVNYDLPQVPEDFIHRVGRTGRAGATGKASTFGTRQERSDIRKIERALNIQLQRQEVSPDIAREDRHAAPVIVMPAPAARQASVQPDRARTSESAPKRKGAPVWAPKRQGAPERTPKRQGAPEWAMKRAGKSAGTWPAKSDSGRSAGAPKRAAQGGSFAPKNNDSRPAKAGGRSSFKPKRQAVRSAR